jgi:hypothetical protein
MMTFDPRTGRREMAIGVNGGSSLSTSPDTSSSTSIQTPQLSYELPTSLDNIDFSMYDPAMLPESYFTDSYFPTDPLFFSDSFDIFNEQPTSNSGQMPRSVNVSEQKPSPTGFSIARDDQYKLSPISSRNDGYPSASPLEVIHENDEADTILKRQRAAKADGISACWTSPLCPNNTKEGTPPNSSTCNGGCAPFLFDNGPLSDSTLDAALLGVGIAAEDVFDSPIEEKPRTSSKRSESVSKSSDATIAPTVRRQSKLATHTRGKRSSANKVPEESIVESIEEVDAKGKKRIPHNEVERKYRDSVNNQMESLRRVIPELQPNIQLCDGADIEDLPAAPKPSKAIVLASATAYIKRMEKEKKQLADEVELLQTRVKALQALVKCEDCSLMQYVMGINLKGGKT